MNNATFESLLAVTFTTLLIVIPFLLIAMFWPDWMGYHITLMGFWLDRTIIHALQQVL